MSTTNIFILGRPFNGISEGVLPGNDSLEFTQFRLRVHARRSYRVRLESSAQDSMSITLQET